MLPCRCVVVVGWLLLLVLAVVSGLGQWPWIILSSASPDSSSSSAVTRTSSIIQHASLRRLLSPAYQVYRSVIHCEEFGCGRAPGWLFCFIFLLSIVIGKGTVAVAFKCGRLVRAWK